jgi:hypothetical protein
LLLKAQRQVSDDLETARKYWDRIKEQTGTDTSSTPSLIRQVAFGIEVRCLLLNLSQHWAAQQQTECQQAIRDLQDPSKGQRAENYYPIFNPKWYKWPIKQ